MTKILYHTNSAHTFFHFRLPLMQAMRERGFDVVACGPRDPYADKIEAAGIPFVDVPMGLSSMHPLSEARSILRLVAVYRRLRPAMVHHFSLKPIAYGSLASRLASIPIVVNTVTGLGHAFSRPGLLRCVATGMLRLSRTGDMWTTFQNSENKELFVRLRLANEGRSVVIRGSGVNVDHFRPTSAQAGRPVTFLFLGRMMWSKGVREYCEAARRLTLQALKDDTVPPRFILVGGALPGNPTNVAQEWLTNPDAIPSEWLASQAASSYLEYRPHDDDVLGHFQEADVVVLPSYYPEGIPRSLLEGMSCGKALITTDTPGCRATVRPGLNGFLVPPRDTDALCASMAILAKDSGLACRMGKVSREMAVRDYADPVIIDSYLSLYRRAGLLVT